MNDLFVRRVYTYKGVNVVVNLDFVQRKVSLVENNGQNKKWLFSDRTPEYLNGWRLILQAMDHAVAEAKKEMDAFDEKKRDEFVELMVELSKNEVIKGAKV